ncbi:TOM1-like protein 6 [Impatiens glandulifera]|uniref:TOM1-like protein 6 n=1 Tax=Impatiens glandulifera TaxID=253017 RepID=UPI001FB0725C|nr:TOM1-like protein 6 [Impatiens glandulifera]
MLPSSSSSSSATVRVDKATSDLLIGPDWTMNMEICDSINSNHWDAKDVVKAVKKRLLHKNPKVQLFALTLLETMVKNCGDYVHFQIADRNLLQEMVKIVKKRTDLHVRDKILVLLDSWQEAFGGPGGKYPQYYWSYEELRRSGVTFPKRSPDAAPIFTPPVGHQRHTQVSHGMPSNFSTRLDEAMAADVEHLSLIGLTSMRNVLELLADMLQAVNPTDRAAVRDEVIVDLVAQCRSNQKKLMQMLTTTGDEELLSQGLELNDSLQTILAKHDAIASGSPLPTQSIQTLSPKPVNTQNSIPIRNEVGEPSQASQSNASTSHVTVSGSNLEEEEDEEDDFAQLARRHSKTPKETISGNSSSTLPENSIPVPNNALAVIDPPFPVKTTNEQDIIDLLSITLSTPISPPAQTPLEPTSSSQNVHQQQQPSFPSMTQDPNYASQAYPPVNRDQPPSLNSYVVPWAQQQSQPQPQFRPQPQPQFQSRPQIQPPQGYIPPPWAATPGYLNSSQNNQPMSNSFPGKSTRPMVALNGEQIASTNPGTSSSSSSGGQVPYVPTYRLFEDLNVLGNAADGKFKAGSADGSTTSMTGGASNQGMVSWRK